MRTSQSLLREMLLVLESCVVQRIAGYLRRSICQVASFPGAEGARASGLIKGRLRVYCQTLSNEKVVLANSSRNKRYGPYLLESWVVSFRDPAA